MLPAPLNAPGSVPPGKVIPCLQPLPMTAGPLSVDQQVMLADVPAGLSETQKLLPSKYFYDEEGSRIFDEITELPEYHLTRTEAKIMRSYGGAKWPEEPIRIC